MLVPQPPALTPYNSAVQSPAACGASSTVAGTFEITCDSASALT